MTTNPKTCHRSLRSSGALCDCEVRGGNHRGEGVELLGDVSVVICPNCQGKHCTLDDCLNRFRVPVYWRYESEKRRRAEMLLQSLTNLEFVCLDLKHTPQAPAVQPALINSILSLNETIYFNPKLCLLANHPSIVISLDINEHLIADRVVWDT